MPPLHPIPTRSLQDFELDVAQGIGKLIEWYVREGHFLRSLKSLTLFWRLPREGDAHFEVPASLLRQCMGTLEDLVLLMSSNVNKGPFMNELSNNGMF